MKVSIVVPTFNEERTIKDILEKVKPYGDEILVVSAKKSTDRTKEIAEEMGIRTVVDNGKGKGDGIRVGIEHASGDIIVFIDADGSHIPEDIPKIVQPIKCGNADMVIASRFMGGSEELHGDFGKFMRMFLSISIAQLINWRFRTAIGDTQNGFRAIKTDVAKDLKLEANIFDVETEMVMKCYKKGYKIVEVSSQEKKRLYGESGINIWRMGWVYAWRVFKNLW
ncbi:MAG: glycosyltransferase family 2 protein [Nanoarchaeota archaeon]|nr:glycosyltransferase family 2 protein [Nanoarchaeota archaeon]MBU1135673.1 glycosyltransferase family 2 protein [Nanoarchaeota archaeon]MBU2520547.1 glycosyltransferase family 2 protein [Nanoarchaeota archaeon]